MKTIAFYCRISTSDGKQSTASQEHELKAYAKRSGWNSDRYSWYRDSISGAAQDRPALNRLLAHVQQGKVSTVCVYDLSRLARNVLHGLETLRLLAQHGCRVVSVRENLEISGSMGAFVANLMLAVAQFERDTIRERVKAGVAAAKIRNGGKWGRSPDWHKRAEVQRLRSSGLSVLQIAEKLNCTRSNVYQLLGKGQPVKATR